MAIETQNIGAGLEEVYVKNSSGNEYRFRGAVNAEGDPANEEVEVKGDDTKLGKFVFSQAEELAISLVGISFDALQEITGNTYSSSATGLEIPLGTDSEQSAPYVQVRAKSLARNESGDSGYFQKTWYKVQMTKIKIVQALETELTCEIEATAYKTDEDIEGAALSESMVALIEHWIS